MLESVSVSQNIVLITLKLKLYLKFEYFRNILQQLYHSDEPSIAVFWRESKSLLV